MGLGQHVMVQNQRSAGNLAKKWDRTVVKYYCVSDNFILTCLLLLLIEDVIKVVRISTVILY